MRYSFALSALALISSAFAITVTEPTSSTKWDFSTPKTIKFSASSGDPPVVSIILIDPSTNFQIKIADNVKTSTGSYTTQPNPSVPSGDGYEIQIIDQNGVLAKSDDFTVQSGASSSESTPSAAASTAAATSSTSSSSGSSASTTAAASSSSSATLATVTMTASSSSTSTTASSTPTGAASSITLNKMTAGVGALMGLAFLFA